MNAVTRTKLRVKREMSPTGGYHSVLIIGMVFMANTSSHAFLQLFL